MVPVACGLKKKFTYSVGNKVRLLGVLSLEGVVFLRGGGDL